MKLTFNFNKGTVFNGEVIEKAEGWDTYTPEQVKQVIDGIAKGYELRFNYPDKAPIVFETEQVESFTVTL